MWTCHDEMIDTTAARAAQSICQYVKMARYEYVKKARQEYVKKIRQRYVKKAH